jgi:hypothetical protein
LKECIESVQHIGSFHLSGRSEAIRISCRSRLRVMKGSRGVAGVHSEVGSSMPCFDLTGMKGLLFEPLYTIRMIQIRSCKLWYTSIMEWL